ncbi:hypothetical protein THAOC_09460 [Thalassiosira oceanica]|uniref:B30.2/SPRY domain-containing protein n=1 Tax=Thalassiosira oceanica TaxID=159749 RepID=K0SWF2_THAOC|nr:hypothetical protein THAOC_09460 [Thalassiosira oceanica]|eukprot:EJK69294.1 hypothetical protein THAOC_09460 [Thalassiosira oceanica]
MSEADNREGVAAKRSKTNDENDNKEGLLIMIKDLKARNEELAARNDELESEIRALRGVGKHDDSKLPVVTKRTVSVDLSRVDRSLVTQVASFLCRSRELLSMALTCKAFGWRRTPSGSSLIEEAARQFLVNQLRPSDVERGALPQHGNDTIAWLSIVDELERLRLPLKFSKLVDRDMDYVGECESRVFASHNVISTAVTNYVMKRGVHYASFKLIRGDFAIVGVARPFRDFGFVNEEEGFDMFEEDNFDDILAQRTDAWVGDVHYCQYHCGYGTTTWTDFQECKSAIHWGRGCDEDDVFGLLVDLNEGSLSVYKNGRFLAMAKDGLAGEYCFFSAMCDDSGVSIKRETPPR